MEVFFTLTILTSQTMSDFREIESGKHISDDPVFRLQERQNVFNRRSFHYTRKYTVWHLCFSIAFTNRNIESCQYFIRQLQFNNFYRATRMHSEDYAVARCLSVCLYVRLSVCHMPVFIKTANT